MWIPHLLLSDDDAAFREAVGEGLRRRGLEVVDASDGAEAIELIESSQLHLAVVDFNMPRLDGLSVLRHVHQSGRQLPCVLLSGQLDESIRREAEAADAFEVLSKPVRLQKLCETIFAALKARYD